MRAAVAARRGTGASFQFLNGFNVVFVKNDASAS